MTAFQLFQQLISSMLATIRCYVLELIVLMFVTLFSLWAFAFLANGLYDYHFDLQSCWGGFSAIGGAGVLAIIKYCTDSWKNSDQGEMPDSFISKFDQNNDGHLDVSEMVCALKQNVTHKNIV